MGKYIFGIGIFLLLAGGVGFGYIKYTEQENGSNYIASEENNDVGAPIYRAQDTNTEKNSAKKEVVLSLDFACPYCRKFYKNSFAKLRKQYKTKIPFKISHYPLQTQGIGIEIAKFYECSLEQVDQWVLLDFLFFQLDEFDLSKKDEWIAELQIEPEPIKICEENPKTLEKILAEKKSAKEKGVQGTPTIFIGGKKFEGNVSKTVLEMEVLKVL